MMVTVQHNDPACCQSVMARSGRICANLMALAPAFPVMAGPGPIGIKIRLARARAFPTNVILPLPVILGLDPRIGQSRHSARFLAVPRASRDPRVEPEDDEKGEHFPLLMPMGLDPAMTMMRPCDAVGDRKLAHLRSSRPVTGARALRCFA